MKKIIQILLFMTFSLFGFSQKKSNSKKIIKPFTCTTFVYNLTLNDMKMKDICFNVIKGDYINLNLYSNSKRRENESWRFEINIKDNVSLSQKNYQGAFYIFENYSEDIIQYHPVGENDEFKALIFDKTRNSWQILLYQNDEYKILSDYTGYKFTNAFGIREKNKSSISY